MSVFRLPSECKTLDLWWRFDPSTQQDRMEARARRKKTGLFEGGGRRKRNANRYPTICVWISRRYFCRFFGAWGHLRTRTYRSPLSWLQRTAMETFPYGNGDPPSFFQSKNKLRSSDNYLRVESKNKHQSKNKLQSDYLGVENFLVKT